jgi:hypothetical protein
LLYGPPWDFALMSIAYILAITPAALGAVGFIVAIVRAIRPQASWILLTGIFIVVVGSMFWLTVELPILSVAKAFYGLPALIPFCALVALGYDTIVQGRIAAVAGRVVMFMLLVWGVFSYSAFWIDANEPATRAAIARRLVMRGQPEQAERLLRDLHRPEDSAEAQLTMGACLVQLGRYSEATKWIQHSAGATDEARRHYLLSRIALANGDQDAAKRENEEGRALDATEVDYQLQRASLAERRRDLADALAAYGDALVIDPFRPSTHRSIAAIYEECGDNSGASRHRRYAELLTPVRQ